MLNSLHLLILVCLPQIIRSSNLALTFDANNNTCTAACSTCSSTDTTTSNKQNDAQLEELLNATRMNDQAIKEMKFAMDGIISTLSRIKDTTTTNAGAINDILLLVEDLLKLHNDSSSSSFSPLPTSCQEIKDKQPNSPSGVYLLATTNNGSVKVYCNMEELCGSGGGWTRLAYLDMTDSTENCPSGFRLYQSGGVRACGRANNTDFSCQSVTFPSNGISYSQVCGRVVGYQYASPDAVQHGEWRNPQQYIGGTDPKHNDINSAYVDGVSITRGSPRQHVWTLMAGLQGSSTFIDGRYNCPCSSGSLQGPYVQSFIGNDYYCESGASTSWSKILYTSDPLWDGQGSGTLETACFSVPGLPWFHRDYGNTNTTDYLELRVCGDQETDDEDVPVGYYEIYVQ